MSIQVCPNCGVRVIFKEDGTCPSCGYLPGVPDSARRPPITRGARGGEPFSHQAAKFSAYAPFIMFLMGFCVRGQVEALQGTDSGAQLALVLGSISGLTTLAALVFGVVGLVGGVRRSAPRTIAFAVVGLALNALLATAWCVILLIAAWRR